MERALILAGDFNATLALEEKAGWSKKNSKTMDDFREFVNDNKLIDVVTSNGFFTWLNQRENFTRFSERLDKFLINSGWFELDFRVESLIIPMSLSNHYPIKLNVSSSSMKSKSCFRFQNMWWRDDTFLQNLADW